jgi:xanthine dehydrogenase iron-sulfur cluster and FAD-binding subunit A
MCDDKITTSIGARPARADIIVNEKSSFVKDILSGNTYDENSVEEYAKNAAKSFNYGSNIRGSAEYREHIAEVLVKRTIVKIVDICRK